MSSGFDDDEMPIEIPEDIYSPIWDGPDTCSSPLERMGA